MPNLGAQFRGETNIIGRRLSDLDHANIMLARDMEKIAEGLIRPEKIAQFARESLEAAYQIVGPR